MGTPFQEFLKARLRLAKLGRIARAAAAQASFRDYPNPQTFTDGAKFVAWFNPDNRCGAVEGYYDGFDDYVFFSELYEASQMWVAKATAVSSAETEWKHSIPWEFDLKGPFDGFISIRGVEWTMAAHEFETPPSWATMEAGVVFFNLSEVSDDGTEERILWEGWIPFQVGRPV